VSYILFSHCHSYVLGYETTSNCLAFTSYLLALNPDKQDQLYREIELFYNSNPVSVICRIMCYLRQDYVWCERTITYCEFRVLQTCVIVVDSLHLDYIDYLVWPM